MTKTEAVNRILRAAGMRTVSALATGGSSDAAEAERVLDDCELEIQSQGWHYNSRYDVTLALDGNGYLVPDSSIISIDTYGVDAYRDAVMVGGKLYDVENNTLVWTQAVKVWYIERHEFDCIPNPVQQYITDYAAYQYALIRHNAGALGGTMVQSALHRYESSRAMANGFDSERRNINILSTASTQRARGDRASRMRT